VRETARETVSETVRETERAKVEIMGDNESERECVCVWMSV